MATDVILAWPRHADYPLWRWFIREERARFRRVFVVFTVDSGITDYADFVRADLAPFGIECFHSPDRGGLDWRHVAVNAALDRSDAEWVWFTEQDFLIHDPQTFWTDVEWGLDHHNDVLGFIDPGLQRWHPACLFVKRRLIDQTARYFGPEPVDHFYGFSVELDALDNGTGHQYELDEGWEHLAGVTENHRLIDAGQDAGVYHRGRFRRYLRDCLAANVPLEPTWAERARSEALTP